jgi:hypothetical protein
VRWRFSAHSALFDHHFMIAALMIVPQRASLVDAILNKDILPHFRNWENVKVAVLAEFWDRDCRGEDRHRCQLFAYIAFRSRSASHPRATR